MKSEPVIQMQGVNFLFGDGGRRRQVLFDINLTFQAGETAVITGPSGSGKTTLLTLIGALRRLGSGRLHVLGCALHEADSAAQIALRRKIGFIFQEHHLFEALTAVDNVRLAMHLRQDYKDADFDRKPVDMLAMLDMAAFSDAKPGTLSRGQQQRVAIARALVNDPHIILGDEPTAALDRDNSVQVVEMLRRRAEETGSAVLIVTHDPRIIEQAPRMIRLADGRIEQDVKRL